MTTIPDPNFVILYVKNVPVSSAFYQGLLGRPPAEASPNFAMFPLGSGVVLGLWAQHDVKPAPAAAPGGSELCIAAGGIEAVDALHREWSGCGIPIIQAPTRMDFGYTFVGCDPDGHRIRVFFPASA